MALLDVRHLSKRWPTGRLALDDVSFEVKEGEILGLLGHNGAGKSTIMGITLGMVRPDQGEVRIGGRSVQQDRGGALRQIGAIYEAAVFYDYLSGWQNLRAICSLSGWWDEAEVKRVVQRVNLTRTIRQKTATYSHGMRQRLALAQALLPQPIGGGRFPVKYYLTAMLFIVFDIEIVFLYPWAVAFDQLALFGLIEMFLFIITVLVVYAYVWRRRGLEWD